MQRYTSGVIHKVRVKVLFFPKTCQTVAFTQALHSPFSQPFMHITELYGVTFPLTKSVTSSQYRPRVFPTLPTFVGGIHRTCITFK